MWNLFDIETGINIFLQQNFPFLNSIMQAFSYLGDELFFMLLVPLFFWCINNRWGLRFGLMLMMSNSLNMVLKLSFHTPRPYWINPAVQALRAESSFGLPSGHSQNTAAMWGLFARLSKKKLSTIFAIFIILMVGISRLHLGVHFLHDVVSGWFTGVLLLIAFARFEKPVITFYKKLSPPSRLNLALVISLLMVFIPWVIILLLNNWTLPETWVANALNAVPAGEAINPMNLEGAFTLGGTTLGMLWGLGWLLHNYQGLPDTAGSIKEKALRYLLGIVGVVIIYAGLKLVTPQGNTMIAYFARYVRYALLGFWIVAAAPSLFIKLRISRVQKIDGIV